MARQFQEMFQDMASLSNDELQELIANAKRRKLTEQPVRKRKQEEAEQSERTRSMSKMAKLLTKLSPEEIAELLGVEESNDE